MRKDVKRTFIFSVIAFIITLVCGAVSISERIEKENSGFTISDENIDISTAGFLPTAFGIITVISSVVTLIMYS